MKLKFLGIDEFKAAMAWYRTITPHLVDEFWVHDSSAIDDRYQSYGKDAGILVLHVFGIRLFENPAEIKSPLTLVMVSIAHAGDYPVVHWAAWPPDKATVHNGRLVKPTRLDINKIRGIKAN